ncbi:hypothetical protein SLEP1_g40976 [Rubroshorea leprosula]|uniref:Uncharacterized protein n=1 Tax=Rubroshorea leprosula TaxID=152421 RepID=A0AAV5L5K9_9ROSI|nr:hypothetical protein SLEP1_g40976 [Rubroshorea leprosula]
MADARVCASSAGEAQAEAGNLCDPDPQRSNPPRSSAREHQMPLATLQAQARPQYLPSMVLLLLLLVHPSPFPPRHVCFRRALLGIQTQITWLQRL